MKQEPEGWTLVSERPQHGVSALPVPSWLTLGSLFHFSGLSLSAFTGEWLDLLPEVLVAVMGGCTSKGVSTE